MGVMIAKAVNPGSGASTADWKSLAATFGREITTITSSTHTTELVAIFEKLLLDLFQNPFYALANANFLGVISFSILFGLGIRIAHDSSNDTAMKNKLNLLLHVFEAANQAVYRIVNFVLNYSPIGVFFLSMVVFSVYGPSIIGPYATVLAELHPAFC
jgi:Na+/H+-dicarboxylate symporter